MPDAEDGFDGWISVSAARILVVDNEYYVKLNLMRASPEHPGCPSHPLTTADGVRQPDVDLYLAYVVMGLALVAPVDPRLPVGRVRASGNPHLCQT